MYLGRYVTSQSFEIQIPLGDPVLLKSRDYSPNITLLYRAWKNILWDKKNQDNTDWDIFTLASVFFKLYNKIQTEYRPSY